ncbi:MAG TPA: AAA family ATPase [Anaerolineales bacterium]|nr:AAA family ATPase [Anaerolineales bacterium]
MPLLERQSDLALLHAATARAFSGSGATLLVRGEAGIGKTALIDHFVTEVRGTRQPEPRVLWGACDALATPRPFGPLHDIAAQGEDALGELLREPNRSTLFTRILELLNRTPTIVVIEDVHWADEATLDFLMFLGRRVGRTRLLFIVTYRDDELGPQHPLRGVLGVLASTPTAQRLDLAPLSVEAISELSGRTPAEAEQLRATTGGNPFFVTEALANPMGTVPATVRDTVLARAARLTPRAWAALEAASVIGLRVEAGLLASVTGEDVPAIDECLDRGLLTSQGNHLRFRHSLAQQTILDAIPPHRRPELHRRVLDALLGDTALRSDLARLVHHAAAARSSAAILKYAPEAAAAAARAGAHREATAHFQLALAHSDEAPPDERARLLEAYADECGHIDEREAGLAARRQAIAVWQELAEPLRVGEGMAHCAILLNGLGRTADAEQDCHAAIKILGQYPPGRELALAYRVQAGLRMLTQDYRAAIEIGQRAIALAEAAEAPGIAFAAHNTIGTAWLPLDYGHGLRYLEQNLRATHEAGLQQLTALAYTNLSSASSELFHFAEAERFFHEGMLYVTERGLERFRLYLLAWHAHTLLHTGRWLEAEQTALSVVERQSVSVTSRITALAVLGHLKARRGEPDAAEVLDEAYVLSRELASLHRIGLVRIARAEAAWLRGDMPEARREAGAVVETALAKEHAWFAGELTYALWRTGASVPTSEWLAQPYGLQIRGEWRAAAELWARLGCPYNQARALAEGDEAAQTTALAIFERLGAQPAADKVREQLRAHGGSIPRGPRASTRKNPFGLTERQNEILSLLADGLTNTEIAARLHLSAKTVDHHVSAVLAKLGVSTRAAAAERFRGGEDS